MKHKSKPAQSFNNDINQKDTRATSLFETDPSISNNDDSGQFNVVDSKDTRQFVKSIAKDAHRIGQDNDIYASVMIAQAILESDSGRSALAKSPNHNLFGIKGAFEGNSVPFNTLEADGNQLYSINAGFRKYPSTKESLKDYSDLIKMVLMAIEQFINQHGNRKPILIKMQHHTYLKHMLQIQTMLRN